MSNSISSAAKAARNSDSGDWIEAAARIGYIAKGAVYTIIGVLAVQAALGSGGAITGSRGAIKSIADEPFGEVLLVLTAVGLLGYAVWRFIEAALDPRNEGKDTKGVVKRVGYVISGALYLGLAFLAASIVFFGSGSGGGGASKEEWTARVLAQPFGQWLVGIAGVVTIGVGLYRFYKAYKASFMRKYDTGKMSAAQRRWIERAGRFGIAARAVVFCIIGVFLIVAALQSDASETRGLSGALQTLSEQPYGPYLLAVVAAGLIAYGVYCFSNARYREFETG